MLPFPPELLLIALACLVAAAIVYEHNDKATRGEGYPVGNFGICGQVNASGEFLPTLMFNPSRQGPWLEAVQGGSLRVECGGTSLTTNEFQSISSSRAFPFARLALQDARIPGLKVGLKAFSPVADQDAFRTCLPVILCQITLSNTSAEALSCALEYSQDSEQDWGMPLKRPTKKGMELAGGSRFAWGFLPQPVDPASQCSASGKSARATLALQPGESQSVRFVYAGYDSEGYYSPSLRNVRDVVLHCAAHWDDLEQGTAQFSDMLPSFGDAQLDSYLRWYVAAGVYLTRITRTFAITMGYCELNQRDSFWTSWLHLAHWPELEQTMLRETAQQIRPDGKVPTTILPVIEREDDLDINCYFVLRVKRYFDFTHDGRLVREIWPAVKLAMEWLETRDQDGDGLLEQGSFWGDWKDVEGVTGRLHAPHFEFAWLGALKACEELALLLADREAEERFRRMAAQTEAAVHADYADGGLWNGRFYTSRWKDGRTDEHVQQDQLFGAVLGLIPPDRKSAIYEALEPSWTEWGIRDTYPYREPFSHSPGDYHNGGVWPFLCFMDAMGRYRYGRAEEAEEIIRRVGLWDLERFADYTPHEYLDGDTGANRGPVIQGWNADIYAAAVWGAMGLQVVDDRTVHIDPAIPPDRPVRTPIRLPWGHLIVEQDAGGTITVKSRCTGTIKVSVGRSAHSEAAAGGAQPVTWQHFTLKEGERARMGC